MAGGGGCADRLVAIVARYALRTERRWSVSSSDLRESAAASDERRADLEKNFSGESGFTVATVRGILDTCRWIGCVTDRSGSGARLGSGFVLDGAALKPGLEGPVFVTNAHVISPTVAIALRPDDALVTFEVESAGAGQPVFHRLEEVVFTSPPSEPGLPGEKGLDVTVARLAGLPAPSGGLPTAKRLPLVDAKAKAYVVGHPRGEVSRYPSTTACCWTSMTTSASSTTGPPPTRAAQAAPCSTRTGRSLPCTTAARRTCAGSTERVSTKRTRRSL